MGAFLELYMISLCCLYTLQIGTVYYYGDEKKELRHTFYKALK